MGYKKEINKQIHHSDNWRVVIRGEEARGRLKRVNGAKYMVTEEDQILGDEYTMPYTIEYYSIVHLKLI